MPIVEITMKTIYCISGLGADERAFSNLKIQGYKMVYLPWLQPLEKETIEQYAKRMSAGITEQNPVLMGLSFGGMMCIEISKLLPVNKIILISSIKSPNELPGWMRRSGKLGLNKFFSMRAYKILEPIQNRILGVSTPDEKAMIRNYRKKEHIAYTNWAVNAALNWRNNWQPPVLFHIHGDNDKLFPIKNVSATHIVKGGGHFMIMNKAEEVSHFINAIL
jgi:pimeloyl-ACP methyl ester carboxylesterase